MDRFGDGKIEIGSITSDGIYMYLQEKKQCTLFLSETPEIIMFGTKLLTLKINEVEKGNNWYCKEVLYNTPEVCTIILEHD